MDMVHAMASAKGFEMCSLAEVTSTALVSQLHSIANTHFQDVQAKLNCAILHSRLALVYNLATHAA